MSGIFKRVSVDLDRKVKQKNSNHLQELLEEAHRKEEISQKRISHLELRINELEQSLSAEQEKNQCLTGKKDASLPENSQKKCIQRF